MQNSLKFYVTNNSLVVRHRHIRPLALFSATHSWPVAQVGKQYRDAKSIVILLQAGSCSMSLVILK